MKILNFGKCLTVNKQNYNTLFTYILNEGANKILLATPPPQKGISEVTKCRLNGNIN